MWVQDVRYRAAKPQPKAIENATKKAHGEHEKISPVFSVQNSVAKNPAGYRVTSNDEILSLNLPARFQTSPL